LILFIYLLDAAALCSVSHLSQYLNTSPDNLPTAFEHKYTQVARDSRIAACVRQEGDGYWLRSPPDEKISDSWQRPGCLAYSSLRIGLLKRLRLVREGQTAQISTETRGQPGEYQLN